MQPVLERGSIDKPLTFDVGLIQLSFIPVCSPITFVKLRRGFALLCFSLAWFHCHVEFSEILKAFEDRTKVEILFPTKTKLSCTVCKGARSTKQPLLSRNGRSAAAAKKRVFYLYLQPIRCKLTSFWHSSLF